MFYLCLQRVSSTHKWVWTTKRQMETQAVRSQGYGAYPISLERVETEALSGDRFGQHHRERVIVEMGFEHPLELGLKNQVCFLTIPHWLLMEIYRWSYKVAEITRKTQTKNKGTLLYGILYHICSLTTELWGRWHYYPPFTHEKLRLRAVKGLVQYHTTSKYVSQD